MGGYSAGSGDPPGDSMAIQIKAFTLLFFVLLIVDALAFHGEYRERAARQVTSFFNRVDPTQWHGLGQGRDWSQPKSSSGS